MSWQQLMLLLLILLFLFFLFTVFPIQCMSLRITQVKCNILVPDTYMHVTTICYIQMRVSERVLMSSRCILVLIIFH